MIPPKKKGPADMGALDELLDSKPAAPAPAPTAAPGMPADDEEASSVAPMPEQPAPPPKGDPAELISSIQTQLAELQSLLG